MDNDSSLIRSFIVQNDEIEKNLTCGICQMIVNNPKECQNCQNLFCKKCIENWITINNQCPYKCSQAPMILCNPHKFIKNVLQNIKVRCPNQACQQIIERQQLESHLKECIHEIQSCQFEGCNYKGSNIKLHQENCEFRYIMCKRCEIIYRAFDIHDCVSSLKSFVQKQQLIIFETQKKIDKQQIQLQNQDHQMKEIQLFVQNVYSQISDRIEFLATSLSKVGKEIGQQKSQLKSIRPITSLENEQHLSQQIEFSGMKKVQKQLYKNVSNLVQRLENLEQYQIQFNSQHSQQEPIQKDDQNHICDQGHNLEWISQKAGKCAECNGYEELLRYKCSTCYQYFCQTCKIPIIKNYTCPQGHGLKIQRKTKYAVCDICHQQSVQSNESLWIDQFCNLSICYACIRLS